MNAKQVIGGVGLLTVLHVPSAADVRAPHVNVRPSSQSAWSEFQKGEGAGWSVRWSRTGVVPEVVRPANAKPLAGWAQDRAASVRMFFGDHAALFALRPGMDDIAVGEEREHQGMRFISVGQVYRGVPVFGADYKVAVGPAGNLRLIAGHFVPDIECDVTPSLDASRAMARARQELSGDRDTYQGTTQLVVERIESRDHLAFVVELRRSRPLDGRRILVDAHTGDVLRNESLVHGATGCALVYPDDPNDVPQEASFSVTDPTDYARLDGPLVHVHDYNGADVLSDAIDVGTGCYDFHYPPSPGASVAFDQVNVYWHAVRYLNEFLPGIGFPGLPFRVLIWARAPIVQNIGLAGLAGGSTVQLGYYVGGMSFTNISDVVYHELQHLVSENFGLGTGTDRAQGIFATALNESFSNYFACAANDDPIFAEYQDSAGLFNCNSPRDQFNYARIDEIWDLSVRFRDYLIGQIWSGALWDLRTAIGPVTDRIALLSYYYLPTQPTFSCAADAVLQADLDYYGGVHEATIHATFQGRGFDTGGPTATIYGPASLLFGESGTFEATVCCGVRPYQLHWTKTVYAEGWGDPYPTIEELGTNTSVTTPMTGPFTLTLDVTDARGQVVQASIQVAYPALSARMEGPTLANPDVPIQFTSVVTGGGPQRAYTWAHRCPDPGCLPVVVGHDPDLLTSLPRHLSVQLTVSSAGDTVVDSLDVWVQGTPLAWITGPSSLAAGQTGTFIAHAYGGVQPYAYRWTKGCFWNGCEIGSETTVDVTGTGASFDLYLAATAASGLPADAATFHVTGTGGVTSVPAVDDRSTAGLAVDGSIAFGGRPMAVSLNVDRSDGSRVWIADVSGRTVALLHHGALETGRHEFRWVTHEAPGGVYFAVATLGERRWSQRIVVLR